MDFHEEIETKWKQDHPLYNDLGITVVTFFKNEIPKHEILPEVSYRTKELLSIIKKIQRKSKEKKYGYDDLKDKLGLRIICSFSSDLNIVDKIIHNNFHVEKSEYKKDILAYDKLDYTSNHYDVRIKTDKIYLKNSYKVKDFVFEIQVRSINQHAWSSSAHILTYKSEADIPKPLQRRVYRLLSLYEIADDEFSNINEQLKDKQNSIIYKFIRSLEGKNYKYAKTDFDRIISIEYFKKLLSPFEPKQQEGLIDKVLNFIKTNDQKIENVMNQNRSRFHKIPILSQPEIYLIFYMMGKRPALLEEIFSNELDYDELEKLKGIWV